MAKQINDKKIDNQQIKKSASIVITDPERLKKKRREWGHFWESSGLLSEFLAGSRSLRIKCLACNWVVDFLTCFRSKKPRLDPQNIDADDPLEDSDSDDSDSDDDTALLMAELNKIRREKAEEQQEQVNCP